jgi:hypothetical protein
VIWLAGDFPAWLPIFTLIGGLTTALIIGAIAAGGAAALGGTAYGIQSAVEGNWPWEDPEAWMTGMLKAHTGGLGQVISSAQGEPTLSEQVKQAGGGTSREGGTAGVMQGATGQGIGRAIDETLTPGPSQQTSPLQGPTPGGGGGAMRYDAEDAGEGPSRGDILKGAWKDIGIGAAQTIGGVALGGALGAAAPAAGSFANVLAGSSSTAPAAGGIVPAVGEAAAGAAPSFLESARQGLQVIPDTIGNTATGILQRSLLGAGMGAGRSALQGENPLRGAAMGGAGGVVGGIAGYGAQQFAPPPVPTITANPFPMPEIGAPDYVGGMAPGAPTLGSFAASRVPQIAGSGASSLVGHLMQPPMPQLPEEPVYSRGPTYAESFDIGGPQATYGQRRPWWG